MHRATLVLIPGFLLAGCAVEDPECRLDGECASDRICVANSCVDPYTDGPLGVKLRTTGKTGPGTGASFVTESTATRPGGNGSSGSTTGGGVSGGHRRWIQVDFCGQGCSVEPGQRDDPTAGRSVLVPRAVELPDAGTARSAVLSCVRGLLGFTGAVVSTEPTTQPYRRVIVTTSAELLGRDSSVKGLAPPSACGPAESAIAFVFVAGTGEASRLVCEEIARQVGFTAGLDTVTDCSDVMSGVERCTRRVFTDRESSCGQLQERPCCWGGARQNGHDRLLEMMTQ